MTEAVGFAGMTIKVGDYVAYPGRRSSSLWMNSGKVLEIQAYPNPYRTGETNFKLKIERTALHSWEQDKRVVWIGNLENVIPLPA